MKVILLSTLVFFLCGACGGSGGAKNVPPCTMGLDYDGDHYGEGCEAGDDCDDTDPAVNTICYDANCNVGIFEGCACDPQSALPVSCYDGPPSTSDSLPCQKGTRTCDPITATWGECDNQVTPSVEICDYTDNDCDGDVDENVLSECGNCIPGCTGAGIDTEPFPMPPVDTDVGADGVGLDPMGDLILDSRTIENHFLWIANAAEGTVSKIDSRSGQEVARYASVTHEAVVDHTGGASFPNWGSVNSPSRTAVDFHGNVWVANRAFSNRSSITKILNDSEDCSDRNGNGVIDTSSDVDGNGVIDKNNPLEFFGESDECIRFTVVVGAHNAIARAIAIDSGIEPGDPGNPWVGMNGEQAFYQINGLTGDLMQRVPPNGSLSIRPYGAAIDSQGRLWAADHCCGQPILIQIQTQLTPAPIVGPINLPTPNGDGSYGLAVDKEDRVWLGGWPNAFMKRYDPASGTTVDVTISGLGGGSWGVRGVGVDTHGNVWGAMHQGGSGGKVVRIDADAAIVTGVWDINGIIPVGVGVDFDGDVWTVNQSTSNASRLHIDQGSLEPANHPTTGNTVDVFPVGENPYTYSDFTGLGLRTITRPTGEYSRLIKPCPGVEEAFFVGVEWDATTPPNTSVEFWVRSGNDPATLSSETAYGPWTSSPADFQMPPGPVPNGQYLELTIRMISQDAETSPIVHSYFLQWACPGDTVN